MAVRGSVRVAIYKQREDKHIANPFWATCDCGWLITNRSDIHEVASQAEKHLLVCNGAPDTRAH